MPKTKNKESFGFTGKDLEIIRHLADFSVSHIDQINRDVFKNGDISFVYRKMRGLIGKNMIEKRYFERNGKCKFAYVLSPKGFREQALKERGIVQTNKFRPQSLIHDMELVDIAFYFKQLSAVAKYYPENVLMANPQVLHNSDLEDVISKRPDALVELKREDESCFFAVEYELSQKSCAKRKSKIDRYYGLTKLMGCLCICRDEAIRDQLLAIDRNRNARFDSRIFYTLLEDVKKSNRQMEFWGRNGEELIIE